LLLLEVLKMILRMQEPDYEHANTYLRKYKRLPIVLNIL